MTNRINTHSDLIVLGGGPAGSATAIRCVQAGLHVTLIERAEFPRHQPGETLHPGIEPLLTQLGVWSQVERSGFIRHTGTNVTWNKAPIFVPFGEDENGPWRGFQANRSELDAMLLTHAKQIGVNVVHACSPHEIRLSKGQVCGVDTDQGCFTTRFVVDATGRRQWLSGRLGLEFERVSPSLYARYGYCEGEYAPARDNPCIVADKYGWTWIARVQNNTYQWTRVDFDGSHRSSDWRPPELAHLAKLGPSLGADVTWRIANKVCGPGYFLTGDAAFVLDPASSHGILKAIMSGILAGECIHKILRSPKCDEHATLTAYQSWVSAWFWNDVKTLVEHYSAHPSPPLWVNRLANVDWSSKKLFTTGY